MSLGNKRIPHDPAVFTAYEDLHAFSPAREFHLSAASFRVWYPPTRPLLFTPHIWQFTECATVTGVPSANHALGFFLGAYVVLPKDALPPHIGQLFSSSLMPSPLAMRSHRRGKVDT